MIHPRPILEFWRWFTTSETRIADAYRSSDLNWLRTMVTPRVKSLHRSLNWEIGPYNAPLLTLVLSPTIRENLPLTRAVVDSAPDLEQWRFLSAKPPKVLNRIETTINGHVISAETWSYSIFSFNSGEFYDIDVHIEEPTAYIEHAVEIVVESLLGEELVLEKVRYINATFPGRLPDSATPIRYLRDHFLSLADDQD